MSGEEANFKFEVIYLATGTTKSPGVPACWPPASAVRVTHIPTGIMAQVGTGRSQHRNKEIATDMVLSALTHPRFRP